MTPRCRFQHLTKPASKNSLDTFCIWYTAGLALVFGSFLILTAVVPICCTRKKVELSQELRKLKHDQAIEKLYKSKGIDPSKFWDQFNYLDIKA